MNAAFSQHLRSSRTRHSMVGGTILPRWHGMTSDGSTMSGGSDGSKGGTPGFRGHDTWLKQSIQVLKQALRNFTLQFSTSRRFRVGLAHACGTQKQNGTGLKITWMSRLQKHVHTAVTCFCQSVTGKLDVNIVLWSRAYILIDPLTKQCALIRTVDFRQATEIRDAICAQIHATPDNSNE